MFLIRAHKDGWWMNVLHILHSYPQHESRMEQTTALGYTVDG